jgi:hypothetical protein
MFSSCHHLLFVENARRYDECMLGELAGGSIDTIRISTQSIQNSMLKYMQYILFCISDYPHFSSHRCTSSRGNFQLFLRLELPSTRVELSFSLYRRHIRLGRCHSKLLALVHTPIRRRRLVWKLRASRRGSRRGMCEFTIG